MNCPPPEKHPALNDVILLIAILLLPSLPAAADQVILTDGDQLSGVILRLGEDTLQFKSTAAGSVRIPWSRVHCLVTETEHRFVLADGQVILARSLCAGDGLVQLAGPRIRSSEVFSLREITSINPPPFVNYHATLSAGGSYSSGNTEADAFNLTTTFSIKAPRHRFNVDAHINYGTTDGRQDTNNRRAAMHYAFYLREHLYSYAQNLMEMDEFQNLNLRTTQGVGLGYDLASGKHLQCAVEAGASKINEDYETAKDRRSSAGRAALTAAVHLLNDHLIIEHGSETYYTMEDERFTLYRGTTSLRFRLDGAFSFALSHEYTYNRNPDPDRDRTDTLVIFALRWDRDYL